MFQHVNTKHALCGHVFSRCWPSDMRFMCLPLEAHSSYISKCICSKHNSPYRELINHGYQCSYMLAHRPIIIIAYGIHHPLTHLINQQRSHVPPHCAGLGGWGARAQGRQALSHFTRLFAKMASKYIYSIDMYIQRGTWNGLSIPGCVRCSRANPAPPTNTVATKLLIQTVGFPKQLLLLMLPRPSTLFH